MKPSTIFALNYLPAIERALRGRLLTCSEIATAAGLPMQKVSFSLPTLQERGIVRIHHSVTKGCTQQTVWQLKRDWNGEQ